MKIDTTAPMEDQRKGHALQHLEVMCATLIITADTEKEMAASRLAARKPGFHAAEN